jgi:hypothetical protein
MSNGDASKVCAADNQGRASERIKREFCDALRNLNDAMSDIALSNPSIASQWERAFYALDLLVDLRYELLMNCGARVVARAETKEG